MHAASNKNFYVHITDPKEADFDITWDPEPILQGKQVTIAGYVSFLSKCEVKKTRKRLII